MWLYNETISKQDRIMQGLFVQQLGSNFILKNHKRFDHN